MKRFRRGLTWALLVTSASTCLVLSQDFGQTDHWIGIWKLNVARSKFEAGPLPINSTMTFQETPGGVKVTNDWVNALGQSNHIEFTARYDGTPVPLQNFRSTISIKRIDTYTFDVTQHSDDGFMITTRHMVSPDRKTLTSSQTVTMSDGVKLINMSVFDRQP